MSKSDAWENALLLLLLNNTNVANVGDATGLRGSTTAGSTYLSLHTADPAEGGTQASSEISTTAYQNYTRMAVARSSAGWTVAGSTANLTANVDFPTAGAASTGASVTHFGVGVAVSGVGVLLYSGVVVPNIAVANAVVPRLTTTTVITED